MTVKVCDVIMGAGKTSAAISMMTSDVKSHFIFITPYLDEVERIKESCAERKFKDPKNRGLGKLDDLHQLLEERSNIASTHALFKAYNQETLELIRAGGYKLILDEVFEVVEQLDIHRDDIEMLQRERIIEVRENGVVEWISEDYEGKFSETLRDICKTGNVILHNGHMMLWTFPVGVFQAFEEVIVLTYMFDAQIQKYYFDLYGVDVVKIGTTCKEGVYHFSDTQNIPDYVRDLHKKIHIVDDKSLNEIGDGECSLSKSWYDRAFAARGQPMLKRMKNNLGNLYKHKFKSATSRNLWTVFKDYAEDLKGKGYTKGFLSFNIRATNAYRDRDCLAYCVNVFYNPFMKNYFTSQGVTVREDDYALSEMIQWIWRSAIRDGREIWIYVPSSRMRNLLRDWLHEQSLV